MPTKLITAFLLFLTFYMPLSSENSTKADVALISVAKSGTYLVSKCIEELTHKSRAYTPDCSYLNKLSNKNFAGTHFGHLKVVNKLLVTPHIKKIVLNIRDPRDVLVSAAYYYNEFKYMDFSCPNDVRDLFSFRDRKMGIHQKIRFFLRQGLIGKHIPTMIYEAKAATRFINKIKESEDSGKFLVVRFEDLVGEKGGKELDTQQKTVQQLSDFLGYQIDEKQTAEISKKLFGNSTTFRSGKVGGWRSHFDETTKTMFKILLADELIELGYEEDKNW